MSQTTKQALADSLKKLLREKPLDKITVTDIAEDCQVNRQTFYYHFRDIYDLLEWVYAREVAALVGDCKTYDSWQKGLLRVFQYAQNNRTLVLRTYHSVSREVLERSLYRVVYALLIDVVEECGRGLQVRREDMEFLAHFYKYSFVGLMLDWVGDNMREDPQRVIDQVGMAMEGSLPAALERFQARRC